MRTRLLTSLVLSLVVIFNQSAFAAPPLTEKNVNVAKPTIKIWNVKATSDVREGSTTSNESGKVKLKWQDGTQTTHDANYKVKSATLFQDGEICHNYGSKCYCGTTTYRLESGHSKWKFAVPSNNTPVPCPNGIQPTGDPDIKKSMTKEEAAERRRKVKEERKAAREQ